MSVVSDDNAFSLNTWHHIAMTWNGGLTAATDVKFYVNGLEVGHKTDTNGTGAKVVDTTNDWVIGNTLNQDATFKGLLDNVMVYNYALDESKIMDLAQNPWAAFYKRSYASLFAAPAVGISMPIVMQQMDHLNGGTFL